MLGGMRHVAMALFALTALSAPAVSGAPETEKEWKVVARPAHLGIADAAVDFLQKAAAPPKLNTKELAELERLRKLVSGQPAKLAPKDLLGLKKVRSIQIGRLGVFAYPYFDCRFRQTDRGIFFEKTSGSQRRSGLVFENDPVTLVFLGASTVNDDPQRQYSGLTRARDASHDSAGLIIRRGRTTLAIFPKKDNAWEVYEFR